MQTYEPGRLDRFSFTTRRRDGNAQYLWSTTDFAFYRPLHVSMNARVELDEALLLAMQADDAVPTLWHDAIVEFNAANTDSPDAPRHAELVMAKSAFEFLLGIGNNVNEFAGALCAAMPALESNEKINGALSARWAEARPQSKRLLDAWAREFCALRGASAHGVGRSKTPCVWSAQAHMAFVGLLFPLLVKLHLAKLGALTLDEKDEVEQQMLEAYLTHDPMAAYDRKDEHPWERVYSMGVLGEVMRRGIAREMDKIDWCRVSD